MQKCHAVLWSSDTRHNNYNKKLKDTDRDRMEDLWVSRGSSSSDHFGVVYSDLETVDLVSGNLIHVYCILL